MLFMLGFKKNTPMQVHKTALVTREYWRDRKEKLRKTGNDGKKLVTTSKNMASRMCRERHTGSFLLEPIALL